MSDTTIVTAHFKLPVSEAFNFGSFLRSSGVRDFEPEQDGTTLHVYAEAERETLRELDLPDYAERIS